MVRILSTVFLFLLSASVCPVLAAGDYGKPFDDLVRQGYYTRAVNSTLTGRKTALAIASDRAYGYGWDTSGKNVAMLEALRNCRRASTSPDTCKIVDVNGESEFLKTPIKSADFPLDVEKVATIPEATNTSGSPAPQPSKAVASQPTEADKKIELEFWQSVKDSDDPDKYREYLRQFPSGVYAGLAKLEIKKLGGDTTVGNASIPNLDYGDYYALVIGNNEYQDLTNLRSAVNDAKVVSTVLEVDYGFNVKLLENASRKEILRSLKALRQSVSAKDNVLIYYAGHGHLDIDTDYGYWLPVDSERDDDSNWIATDRVISQVKGMKAKHVQRDFNDEDLTATKPVKRNPVYLALRKGYRKQLGLTLRYRYVAVGAVVVMAIMSIAAVSMLPVRMFPDEDFDQIIVQYDMSPGTSLEITDNVTRQIEAIVGGIPEEEVKAVVAISGYQIKNYEFTLGSHLGEVNIDLVSAADRSRSDREIMKELRQKIGGVSGIVSLNLSRPQAGPPTGNPVEIRILGPRLEVLEELGEISLETDVNT